MRSINLSQEQATHLDLILTTLIHDKNKVGSVDDIKEVLLPDKPREYCLSLFYILSDYYPPLLYPIDNLNEHYFWAREYVGAFLHEGGFTAIFNNAAAREEVEEEKRKLEIEKLKYDVKNSKRIYKTYWLTFTFALISFVYVLIQIIQRFTE